MYFSRKDSPTTLIPSFLAFSSLPEPESGSAKKNQHHIFTQNLPAIK